MSEELIPSFSRFSKTPFSTTVASAVGQGGGDRGLALAFVDAVMVVKVGVQLHVDRGGMRTEVTY
jgi:hypothetical protein